LGYHPDRENGGKWDPGTEFTWQEVAGKFEKLRKEDQWIRVDNPS